MHKVAADLELQGIPHLHHNKRAAAEEQRHELSAEAVVTQLPVNELVLNNASDLPINHPVKLGDQRHIKAILPVLGEKREPVRPPLLLPVPRVEYQLALVNDQENSPFLDLLPLEEDSGVVDQVVRGKLVVRNIGVIRFLEAGQVTRKVPDHRLAKAGTVDHIPCIMQALPRTGSAGV